MSALAYFLIGLPALLLALAAWACARDGLRDHKLTRRQEEQILAKLEQDLDAWKLHKNLIKREPRKCWKFPKRRKAPE